MMENLSSQFHAHIKNNPLEAVNFRKIFEFELFGISMKEVSILISSEIYLCFET